MPTSREFATDRGTITATRTDDGWVHLEIVDTIDDDAISVLVRPDQIGKLERTVFAVLFPWWWSPRAGWLAGIVAAYQLGVHNERWWPGAQIWPLDPGEALVDALFLILALSPTLLRAFLTTEYRRVR